MARKHLIVSGEVQGVGFRYFARREAQQLGVSGWVRNCPDGTVEIEAQADSDTLESFIDVIRQGPSFSSVDALDEESIPDVAAIRDFAIRY